MFCTKEKRESKKKNKINTRNRDGLVDDKLNKNINNLIKKMKIQVNFMKLFDLKIILSFIKIDILYFVLLLIIYLSLLPIEFTLHLVTKSTVRKKKEVG